MIPYAIQSKTIFSSPSFSSLLHQISDSIVIVDKDLTIRFVNQRFLQSYPELSQILNCSDIVSFFKDHFVENETFYFFRQYVRESKKFTIVLRFYKDREDSIIVDFVPFKAHNSDTEFYALFFKNYSVNPIEKQLTQYALLKTIIKQVEQIDNINALIRFVVYTLHKNKFSYHHVSVFFKDVVQGEEVLRLIDLEGKSKDYFLSHYPKGYYQSINQGIAGRVAKTGDLIFEKDVSQNPLYHSLPDFRSSSELCVPIKIDEKVFGVINIESEDTIDLDDTDVQMVQAVADLVGLAIKNLTKAQELEKRHRKMEEYLSDLQESKEKLENQSFELHSTLEQMEKVQKIITQQNEILAKELKIGAQLQKSLLPKQLPQHCKLRFDSIYIPALELGGDFFDVQRLDENHVSIFIADVSGHGVSAALIAAMLKAFYSNHVGLEIEPHELLSQLNQDLISAIQTDNFVTAFYILIDSTSHTARFSSAAHPKPLLIRNKSGVLNLDTEGFVLGMFKEGKYQTREIQLIPGDRLLFYTDGVIETKNKYDEQFGLKRLSEDFSRNVHTKFNLVLPAFRKRLRQFSANNHFEDDITLLFTEIGA